ncbi:hypothetical protein Taro_027873 [Colocasia esculenta]|uniref:Thioredoxin domain-containing protein n=1 Tax=Colocasia esculenta TaxID=4460 RepID=A0A843VSN7_COLES|nr:hypothetical protein [Colocasia esculenta]
MDDARVRQVAAPFQAQFLLLPLPTPPPLRSAPFLTSSCFALFPSGAQVVEQSVLTVVKAVEDKLDEEIAALERLDLDDLEALRERRLQQLKKASERRTRWAALGHGEYTEIAEKEFFATVKASDRVVCHFYRENWPCKGFRANSPVENIVKWKITLLMSCSSQVMDKHLNLLANQHMETRFIKIHAEKSPFLTEKLKIVVLPTLALIKHAKVEDYVVGFDELGGTDEFCTQDLEERLARSQAIIFEGETSISQLKTSTRPQRSVRQSETANSSDSE